MTRVALLWHMHQPFYADVLTGEHILPWVRLHAIKDYYGMVAVLREFPGVKVTFNLVPSLLAQLDAFASETARDRHLEIGLAPAESLSPDERVFCVEQFFHAHRPKMIDPYPRYRELLERRDAGGQAGSRAVALSLSTAELRDLQVWHKLVWLDPLYLNGDPRVRRLLARGRDFTEEDKQVLRAIELELIRKVVPEYRDAAARGQVELSTSPFYHPILPLLCDTDIYLRTHPHSRMPRERFQRRDDAMEQLRRAAALHARLFGTPPRGLWPSEGSVSDEVVALAGQLGFQWMATDEEILARTLGRGFTRNEEGHLEQPEVLYRPYRVGTGTMGVLFRDHALSDLVGFTYASWSAEHAAADFVRRVEHAGRRYTARTGGDATIAVILDGENAWEYYDGGGRPFLRALYGALAASAEIQTVTMGEAVSSATTRLEQVFPGSWINGDFYIWIGHRDDHRAWDQLSEARATYERAAPAADPAARDVAYEELLIAEGSDWCWWYGDDHSSEHDLAFDELFRRHVRNVYRALNLPIPEGLFVTNITTAPPTLRLDPPTGLIRPEIDGEVTSYFEWVGAGIAELSAPAGAMHQVSVDLEPSTLAYGFDEEHLYVRIEAPKPWSGSINGVVGIDFVTPAGFQLRMSRGPAGVVEARLTARGVDGRDRPVAAPTLAAAIGTIVEARIPFASLGVRAREAVALLVTLGAGTEGAERRRYPAHRAIELEIPGAEFGAAHWSA